MDYKQEAALWLSSAYFDEKTKAEIRSIADEEELKDRFSETLAFGTAGMRGVIAAGTNRMNIYTVRRATYGLANYLKKYVPKSSNESYHVAISYDNRHGSQEFALNAALVLCACDIRVSLFDRLSPTPELSFAVRYLKCDAGIMVTASHNPKEYNGYKAYNSEGCQFLPNDAKKIVDEVNAIQNYESIPLISREMALKNKALNYLDDSFHQFFYDAVLPQSVLSEQQAKQNLKIVYTPLHGTGSIPVKTILKTDGFSDVTEVKEQAVPDPNFSTVVSPNPENKDALDLAIRLAESVGADLVIGTDPDADRVGSAVLHQNRYQLLSGNQVGALLLDFILSRKQQNEDLPKDAFMVKTIVTSELGGRVAQWYNVAIHNVLTGFKYIGEQITLSIQNRTGEFQFGYEESYGYLAGTHVRDKDAVVTSMLLSEMTAYYKKNGKTLVDALEDLYQKFGYYEDVTDSYRFEEYNGDKIMARIMDSFRKNAHILLPEYDFVVKKL
jgi:phosphoglucomutase